MCLTQAQCLDPDKSKVLMGQLFDAFGKQDYSWAMGTTVSTPSTQYSDYCKNDLFLYEWACVPTKVNGTICFVPTAIPFYCGSVQKKCSTVDVAKPEKKVPARCVTDLCPGPAHPGVQLTYPYASQPHGPKDTCAQTDACLTIEGPQPNFLFDSNADGVKDSCNPDLCLMILGPQTTYPYDLNSDGAMDSCDKGAVVDLCPQTVEIDTHYPFDTNFDGTNDSCSPPNLCGVTQACPDMPDPVVDFCPDQQGVQVVYPHDTDHNGTTDSCLPLIPSAECTPSDPSQGFVQGLPAACMVMSVDHCPDLDGVQAVYLYDTDGDGVTDACSPPHLPPECVPADPSQGMVQLSPSWCPSPSKVDFCPALDGIQTAFLYDTNNNGMVDSCVPPSAPCNTPNPDGSITPCPPPLDIDLCPELAGTQPEYPYDTNNDGVAESCTPPNLCGTTMACADMPSPVIDFCPNLPGAQQQYPFDGNHDGSTDTCLAPHPAPECVQTDPAQVQLVPLSCLPPPEVDRCPTLDGIQSVYPIDTDYNGSTESCLPVHPAPECVQSDPTQLQVLPASCFPPPPVDHCSEHANIQPAYPYDTNSDGIADSCSPP